MRELLLLFGLVSVGYVAESSICLVLNRSCVFYEEAATAKRNEITQKRQSTRFVTTNDSANSLNFRERTEWVRRLPNPVQSNPDEFLLTPVPDLNDVSVSQTASNASQRMR